MRIRIKKSVLRQVVEQVMQQDVNFRGSTGRPHGSRQPIFEPPDQSDDPVGQKELNKAGLQMYRKFGGSRGGKTR